MQQENSSSNNEINTSQLMPANKNKVRHLINNLAHFISKNKRAIAVVLAIVVTFFAIFILLPVVSIGSIKYVNLNSTVRIEKSQLARLKLNNVSVNIVNFTNETCPKDKICFGKDEKSVEYNLKINNKSHATGSATLASESSYQIETISSDYETYAIIKIVKR